MDKVKYFYIQVNNLFEKLNIKDHVLLKRDNRLGNYIAHVQPCDCGCGGGLTYIFRYNTKQITKMSKLKIILAILHEFGHISLKHKGTIDNWYQNEYEAEEFAMKKIKELFPDQYGKALEYLRAYEYNDNPIYRKAFINLYWKLTNEK